MHKNDDPELEINMPMTYNCKSYNKNNAKTFCMCKNAGIVKHFPIPISVTIMRNPFSLSNLITVIVVIKVKNNKACKNQKPDYARDAMFL